MGIKSPSCYFVSFVSTDKPVFAAMSQRQQEVDSAARLGSTIQGMGEAAGKD